MTNTLFRKKEAPTPENAVGNEGQDAVEREPLTLKSCDPDHLKCATCVWAYVFKHLPTDMSCGVYRFKPKRVYMDGAECPKYEALKNI